MGIGQLLAIGGTIVVAVISGWFGQAGRTDTKLEAAESEYKANNLALVQRVAINETKTDNLEKKVDEIRGDVKEILRRLK